jgi:hypothetical protein
VDDVSGQKITEHTLLRMSARAREALAGVLREIEEDDQFPLNELEEEVVQAVRRVLES